MKNTERRDSIDNRRRGDYAGPMEPRVDKLERDVAKIAEDVSVLKTDVALLKTDVALLKTDVAIIKANYVTKAELQAAMYTMSWRIFGAMGVLCAAVFWIARNVEPPARPVSTAISQPGPAAVPPGPK